MKKTNTPPPAALLVSYRILLGIAGLLALILIGGSLYALFRGPPEAAEAPAGETVYSGGQIRAVTAGPAPATVVLSIAFPYPPEDREFSGELYSHIEDFQAQAASYFGSLSAPELRQTGEDAVKEELLRRFNSLLRLGRIEKLYFSDYMILE
ncbi:MAG: flagellar basal body protein FliL [Spirochaetaceae bacterium]|jgi:flagellar basal body-associated protein FliL|nr:flagellar basal body protein FliL [Spirochaetaceae bacterium]